MNKFGFGPKVQEDHRTVANTNKAGYEECEVPDDEESILGAVSKLTAMIKNQNIQQLNRPKFDKVSSRSTKASVKHGLQPVQKCSGVAREILKELVQIKANFDRSAKNADFKERLSFGEGTEEERLFFIGEFWRIEDYLSHYLTDGGGILYTLEGVQGLSRRLRNLKAKIYNFSNGYNFYCHLEDCVRKVIFLGDHQSTNENKKSMLSDIETQLRQRIELRRRQLKQANSDLEVKLKLLFFFVN